MNNLQFKEFGGSALDGWETNLNAKLSNWYNFNIAVTIVKFIATHNNIDESQVCKDITISVSNLWKCLAKPSTVHNGMIYNVTVMVQISFKLPDAFTPQSKILPGEQTANSFPGVYVISKLFVIR